MTTNSITYNISEQELNEAKNAYNSLDKTFKKLKFIQENSIITFIGSVIFILGSIFFATFFYYKATYHINFVYEDTPNPKAVTIIGGVIELLICLLLFWLIMINIPKQYIKKIQRIKLPFCWLYNCINELNYFKYNVNNKHLLKANYYLLRYLETSEFNFDFSARKPLEWLTLSGNYLPYLIIGLQNRYTWINFSKETLEVANTMKKFENRLLGNIENGANITTIVDCLNKLLLYEKEKFHLSKNKKLSEKGKDFFNGFILDINNLSDIEIIKNKNYKFYLIRLNKKLFYSEKLIINFLSWYIIIQIMILLVTLPLVLYFKISFDSTLIIGITTTPILAAISILAFSFNKNNTAANKSIATSGADTAQHQQ